ncbi:MAG TPA: TetR/AcrR family transcriptional regulator [Jiangellaceae bacterium]|nr:TetR/AcrR family transcriptional regulator [Jiangellaceae bacterium]
MTSREGLTARQRILETAYDLFSHRGVRDVGVDEIIARSGVAKATLYNHFPTKNHLVLAFLDLREERWTFDMVETEARARGGTPEEHLLAIFDVFGEWFHREDFDGPAFISVLLEMGPLHPLGRASIQHLENINALVAGMAEEADLREPREFALSWHILMKGSIIAAIEGDIDAANRAKDMARHLIERHRLTNGAHVGR